MSTTQPIRDREELQRFKNYYLLDEPNYRNYGIWCLMTATYESTLN